MARPKSHERKLATHLSPDDAAILFRTTAKSFEGSWGRTIEFFRPEPADNGIFDGLDRTDPVPDLAVGVRIPVIGMRTRFARLALAALTHDAGTARATPEAFIHMYVYDFHFDRQLEFFAPYLGALLNTSGADSRNTLMDFIDRFADRDSSAQRLLG